MRPTIGMPRPPPAAAAAAIASLPDQGRGRRRTTLHLAAATAGARLTLASRIVWAVMARRHLCRLRQAVGSLRGSPPLLLEMQLEAWLAICGTRSSAPSLRPTSRSPSQIAGPRPGGRPGPQRILAIRLCARATFPYLLAVDLEGTRPNTRLQQPSPAGRTSKRPCRPWSTRARTTPPARSQSGGRPPRPSPSRRRSSTQMFAPEASRQGRQVLSRLDAAAPHPAGGSLDRLMRGYPLQQAQQTLPRPPRAA